MRIGVGNSFNEKMVYKLVGITLSKVMAHSKSCWVVFSNKNGNVVTVVNVQVSSFPHFEDITHSAGNRPLFFS